MDAHEREYIEARFVEFTGVELVYCSSGPNQLDRIGPMCVDARGVVSVETQSAGERDPDAPVYTRIQHADGGSYDVQESYAVVLERLGIVIAPPASREAS